MQSKAATVDEYLKELPPERREVIMKLRKMLLEKLPDGYIEAMNWGMISYEIPLSDYPDTYNGQPLSYIALSAQKNYYSLYLMGVYMDAEQEKTLLEGFSKIEKKPNMGKSCVRFKRLEDIPLDVIAELVARTSPAEMIARYEAARNR